MQNIVVFGAGGHAKAVIDIIEKAGLYRISGLLDGYKAVGSFVYGYPVLGDEGWLADNTATASSGIVAIGDNSLRAAVVAKITAVCPSFTFISAIHPSCSIAKGASLGEGSVVMAGGIVGSDTIIGEHCVLYSQASAEHDSVLGRFVTLAPKAGTGGGVTIGDFSVISLGASVIHGKTIGEHTVIGAGSTVLSDIPAFSVAYGTPARVIRARAEGERYL